MPPRPTAQRAVENAHNNNRLVAAGVMKLTLLVPVGRLADRRVFKTVFGRCMAS
jgi:hypothetical protein